MFGLTSLITVIMNLMVVELIFRSKVQPEQFLSSWFFFNTWQKVNRYSKHSKIGHKNYFLSAFSLSLTKAGRLLLFYF